MCRLLGVIALRPAPLAELLADDLEPFLELAAEHGDGWGISYIGPSNHAVTVKEPVPARQSVALRTLVKSAVTGAAILHLRLADPGLAVTGTNTQPFGDSHCVFAHNGRFSPVGALDETLGPALAAAVGDTDSERFYLAVRQRVDAGSTPAAAISAAAVDIQVRSAKWESLNCMLLTPLGLHAYSAHSPSSEVLKRRGRDYFDLRYLAAPGRIIVASTGWSQPSGDWRQLPEGLVLEVSRDLQLALRRTML